MKTLQLKPQDVQAKWWLLDATDLVVGRVAAQVAPILIGKHQPSFTPHVLCGDFVVIVNAEKVRFTGRKMQDKVYRHYTGYAGGLRITSALELQQKSPTQILRLAIRRMLPKSKLGRRMLDRLKIYSGSEHPHQAQQPAELKLQ
jgi:large subunit ribosomal protein L13